MSRKKAPQSRREALLEQAQQLFFERGYEATVVTEVIARAGVSNGAFFHHFPSKEALLEAVAERLAEESAKAIREIVEAPGAGALERLQAVLQQSRALKKDATARHPSLFEALFWQNNIILYHRIALASIPVLAPLL